MTGYYKKNNKGGNTYGEARRGKGQNQSHFVGSSNSTKTPLEIAREEDNLEEELGYRVPGLNGLEGADAEDVQLGWLVNASAVRFIRIIFFFVCFFFVSAIEIRKSSPRENSKNATEFARTSTRCFARLLRFLSFRERVKKEREILRRRAL